MRERNDKIMLIAILYFFLTYGIIKLFGNAFLLVWKLAMLILMGIWCIIAELVSQKTIAKA